MRRIVSVLAAVAGLVGGLSACSAGHPANPAAAPLTSPALRRAASATAVRSSARTVERPGPGQLLVRSIPGVTSGFAARPAIVYLPPSTRTDPHRHLPVLVLLHGTSGGPTDWLRKARLAPLLAAFAAAHGGAAPIVVMPDINGALHADTECVGPAERYLTEDVPRWISAHVPAAGGHASWAVAGLSEGGTCALMLSLRHPRVFPTFGDFGGLARPTVGSFDAPAATVRELFGGSRTAYDEHDPGWLLTRHRYPMLTGWFECGATDPTRRDQDTMVRLSRAAALSVVARTTPGGHNWSVWRRATVQLLSWFWARVR